MDADLCLLARSAGRLRLALGSGLDALARGGGHHELGFSSVEAYALERCERSARWVQQTRALVRALSELPAIRRALVSGSLGFSMAQVLATVARPETERAWLADARSRTVRQMRALVEERHGQDQAAERAGANGATAAGELAGASGVAGNPSCEEESQRRCTLTVTVDHEDAWLFECARMIARQAGGPTTEDAVEALLGEGTTSLLASMKRGGDFCLPGDEPEDYRQQAWEAQLARWREEAEVRCEGRFEASAGRAVSPESTDDEGVSRAGDQVGGDDETDITVTVGDLGENDVAQITVASDATTLDAELRRTASQLAVRDVELGALAETFWKTDGWRRLGYATDSQYARERLGTSLTSVKARRRLARHVLRLPALGDAIRSGSIGYEAARLVASVATEETLPAWLARAGERTVKHLREEVDAAEMLARLGAGAGASLLAPARQAPHRRGRRGPTTLADASGPGQSAHLWPPSEETMRALAALESHIVSGAVFRDDVPTDGPITGDSTAADGQVSAGDTAADATPTGFGPTTVAHGAAHAGEAMSADAAGVDGQMSAAQADGQAFANAAPGAPGDPMSAEATLVDGQMSAEAMAPAGQMSADAAPGAPGKPMSEDVAQVRSQMSANVTATDSQVSAEAPSCLTQLSGAVSAFLERLERREREEDGRSVEASLLDGAATTGKESMPLGAGVAPGAPSGATRRLHHRHRARGRVTLRLAVTEDLRRYYRWLERLFERRGPRGVPFVRFLCASLVETWKDSFGSDHAYAEVYARDRYRCTSPVCASRHVTPHHLRFRSAGGDDSGENLTSLCVWCHLEGVHRGRLRATPPASDVTWTLGRRGHAHTTVRGRRRVRGDMQAAAA